MINKEKTGIQRGQAVTFRLPSDTPDHIIKELQKLKETERRNFSSKIAEFVLEGVSNYSQSKERETITIPLPKQLSQEQRNWIRHSHSEAMLGSIVYQLLADPLRATSVLASLNSNALDINEALYLQENEDLFTKDKNSREALKASSEESDHISALNEADELEDDLMNFDWNSATLEPASSVEKNQQDKDEDRDDLLGSFLDQMNK
jgi:hypothetical protein